MSTELATTGVRGTGCALKAQRSNLKMDPFVPPVTYIWQPILAAYFAVSISRAAHVVVGKPPMSNITDHSPRAATCRGRDSRSGTEQVAFQPCLAEVKPVRRNNG